MDAAIRSCIVTLTKELKAKMTSIVKAYDEFPNQSQKLEFPSFSVSVQEPRFEACSPYIIKKNLDVVDAQGRKQVVKCVGTYDFNIQLDFWCESKFDRHEIYKEFFSAFHQSSKTMGLNLKMENYFDQYMSFAQTNAKFMDDNEMSSQRNEWRIKVDIVGSCNAILSKMEHLMEVVEQESSVTNETLLDPAPAEINQVI